MVAGEGGAAVAPPLAGTAGARLEESMAERKAYEAKIGKLSVTWVLLIEICNICRGFVVDVRH